VHVLEDGRYRLDDGRILTAEEVTRLHRMAPLSETAQKRQDEEARELSEGESSGRIQLED
jgi:hypothetical protein